MRVQIENICSLAREPGPKIEGQNRSRPLYTLGYKCFFSAGQSYLPRPLCMHPRGSGEGRPRVLKTGKPLAGTNACPDREHLLPGP